MRRGKDFLYKIEFKNGKPESHHRTLKSIYDYHSVEDIGCKVEWLWQNKIGIGNSFENEKVQITFIRVK